MDGPISSTESSTRIDPRANQTLSPEMEQELLRLQESAIARYPKKVVGFSKIFTHDLKRNLQQTGEFALRAFRTDVRVEGQAHSGSTIFVLNHPLWVEDLFFLTRALGDKTRNLKVLTTEELFLAIPPKLRHHFIPVDTGLHEQKMKLKGLEKAATDAVHAVLPNSPLREAGERNNMALQIAAQHVSNGGDLAIFEERNLDDLIRRTDEGKTWFGGIGGVIEGVGKLMPAGQQSHIQMMAIEYVKGHKKNLLGKKSVDLTIANPIALNDLTLGINPLSRKAITRRVQELYAATFRYKIGALSDRFLAVESRS